MYSAQQLLATDAETAAKYQHAVCLTSTVMIGVKLCGMRGGDHFSADQMGCKPSCQLLPTTQQLCNIPDNQDHSLPNSLNNFQIKQELQSDNEEDNPTHHNFCPASPETKQHFKTEESEDVPIIESVESLSEVSVKQEQDDGLSQPKGLPTPSQQHFGHQVTGVEAVDNRLGKIEKENADKFTINHTNVKEEMESCDDSQCDRVCQSANTCDGNAENDTSVTIRSVQSENVEGVTDVGGRSSDMEETDEDLEMTVEEGEVFCQKRGNWFSEVGEKEGADSPDLDICNADVHDQNDASQAKLKGMQELCEDSSFGVMTVNENKEEKDGGISERKTRELSSKDKKSDKQPSNLCEDNLLGRKSSDSNPSSLESSPGHNNKKKARHQCEVCGYTTNKKSHLADHMRVHTQQKPFVCDICNKSFTQKGNLQHHKSLHSGDKQFQCDICNKSFTQRGHLQRHKNLHSGDKQFQCDICNKSFTRKGHFQVHKSLHIDDKQFQCDICSKNFTQKATLQRHKSLHSGGKQFQCDICNKSFTRKGDLQRHKSLHSGGKQFQCDICNKSFTRKGSLQRHKSLHSGGKQFQCDICGRRFSRSAHLKAHMITHTGMRRFKCKMCGVDFTRQSRLTNHRTTQHQKNAPIIPCNSCQFASKYKRNTKAHEIRIHTKK